MRRALCRTIVLGVTAALAVAGSVFAAPGGGATVTKAGDCYSFDGYATCFASHYITNSTSTPSGNQQYVTNGQYTSSTTGPGGYQATYTEKIHSFFITRPGEVEVDHYSNTNQLSFPGGVCTYRFRYHWANGAVRVYVDDYECTYTS